jgi:hypothetical protein
MSANSEPKSTGYYPEHIRRLMEEKVFGALIQTLRVFIVSRTPQALHPFSWPGWTLAPVKTLRVSAINDLISPFPLESP